MKMNVYAIYDSKAEVFAHDFWQESTDASAIRQFTSIVNNPKSMICQHPADFTLFHIGSWDKFTGELEGIEARVALGNGLDFKESPPGQGDLLEEMAQQVRQLADNRETE